MTENARITPLVERYAKGVDLLKNVVAGMTPDQREARPVAGKWSTAEVVAHLADFEIIGVDRLATVIAETDPPLPGRDERLFAARLSLRRARF